MISDFRKKHQVPERERQLLEGRRKQADMSQALRQDSSWYEVESIIDDRFTDNLKEYLLRWQGYGPESDSWVHRGNMRADQLIKEYEQAKREERLLRRQNHHNVTTEQPEPATSSISPVPACRARKYTKININPKMPPKVASRCRHFMASVYDVILYVVTHGPRLIVERAVTVKRIQPKLHRQLDDFYQNSDVGSLIQYVIEHLDGIFLASSYDLYQGQQLTVGARVQLVVGILICVASCYQKSDFGDLITSHLCYHHALLIRKLYYSPKCSRVVTEESFDVTAHDIQLFRDLFDTFKVTPNSCACE